jgi:hypothetical protein
MNPEEIAPIIQDERFWWNALDDQNLFDQKGITYDYRPYSLKFEEPTLPKRITIRVFIYLDIILGNTQLLDAGLVTDFYIHTDSFDNIKDELQRIGQQAHDRFVEVFNQRNRVPYISPTFQPTFDPVVSAQKIQQLLHEGVGY